MSIPIRVQLTGNARQQLQSMVQHSNRSSVRIYIDKYTWEGVELKLALDEPNESDMKVQSGGVDIIFNHKDKLYIHKSVVDFFKIGDFEQFEIKPWFGGF